MPIVNKVLLQTLKQQHLKQIAQQIGSKVSGTKPVIINGIEENLTIFNQLDSPLKIVSIDPGVKNLGVTKLYAPKRNLPIVESCFKDEINLDLKSTNLDFARATIDFLKSTFIGFEPDVVLIEQQRSRSGGGKSIPTGVLKANILEGMLFAGITALYPQTIPLSISPKSVVNYWEPNEKRTYAMSKKLRQDLVAKWVESGELKVDLGEGKKDDVCDSLVQGITWLKWREYAHELARTI